MQLLLHPRARGLTLAYQSLAQIPHMLAGVIKIQHLHRAGPTVLRHVPNPRRAIADHQFRLGTAQAVFDVENYEEYVRIQAEAAVRRLRAINSTVELEARVSEYAPHNALALLNAVDLALDGSDNFATRLLHSEQESHCYPKFSVT